MGQIVSALALAVLAACTSATSPDANDGAAQEAVVVAREHIKGSTWRLMAYEDGARTCVFLDRLGADRARCVDLTGGMAAYGEVLTPDAVPYAVGVASADVGTVVLGLELRTSDRVVRDERRVSLTSDSGVGAHFFMVPLVKGQQITEVEPAP